MKAISGEIEVVDFDQSYAADFARLNYDWIGRYFRIEPHDREMLDHPLEFVIEPGGQIFFALENGKAVGTVALIAAGTTEFELAKMAVSPDHRGRGIGDLLMVACIEYARNAGKKSIFLESNTRLEPAIRLYSKHGFLETPIDPKSLYDRANIRMELALTKSSM